MTRDWAWALCEGRHGPDHYCMVTFAPSDAGRLGQLVRDHPLPGFVYDGDQALDLHRHCGTRATYVDDHAYAQLAASRAIGHPVNVWIYSQIEVCDNQLRIERGYGSEIRQVETTLILSLIQAPQVTLVAWAVMAGGEGYDTITIARGTTKATLLEYLRVPSSG